MLVLLASPTWRWRIFAGSILFQILYETSKYPPRHQRHLGEANKANKTYRAHLFDNVSTPLKKICKIMKNVLYSGLQQALWLWQCVTSFI